MIENAAKTLTELGVSNEIIGKCATILAKDKDSLLHKWFQKYEKLIFFNTIKSLIYVHLLMQKFNFI